jgi:hypothetical protein
MCYKNCRSQKQLRKYPYLFLIYLLATAFQENNSFTQCTSVCLLHTTALLNPVNTIAFSTGGNGGEGPAMPRLQVKPAVCVNQGSLSCFTSAAI